MSGRGNPGSGLNNTIEGSRVGDGYRADYALPLGSWTTSTGATLGTGTTPIRDVSANQQRFNWAAADTAAAMFSTRLIGEYSDTSHELVFVASMLQTGSTDTITFTATIYARSPGGALKGPFTATAVLTGGGTNPEEVSFDFTAAQDSGDDYIEPGDDITLSIAPGTHGTDAAFMYGMVMRPRRNAALTDREARVAEYD